MTFDEIKRKIIYAPARSAWARGVKEYALEMLNELDKNSYTITAPEDIERALLNGAKDWEQYSWGECSLISDEAIAVRLYAPWELKKTQRGWCRPNSREDWLDVQTRALYQAANLIKRAASGAV